MVKFILNSFKNSSKSDFMKIFLFILFAIPILFPIKANAIIPQIQREALIALYNATDGDNWTTNSGWKDPPLHSDGFAMPETECEWYGVDCDATGDNIKWLILDDNNLSGIIPPEIGNLRNLVLLRFERNQLDGNIPSEIGNLTNLESLWIYNNQLSGSIPPEIGNLSNLVLLRFERNQLDGNIPSEIGNLTNLESLWIYNNQLSGSIPPEIGNLSNLKVLRFSSNQLDGKIPPEIGKLGNLKQLYLRSNQLSGSIPPEIGNLTNLDWITLRSNKLSGCIPAAIGSLNNLEGIQINNNYLSGEIPVELMNLENLDDGLSDFRHNHLYTSNTDLKNFLDQKQYGGDWESYQTFDMDIAIVEPLAVCGIYGIETPCYPSIQEAIDFATEPSLIYVAEGDYYENVTIESGFTIELGWTADFNCDVPTQAVVLWGSSE